jgi:hypothetical protein
MRTLTALLNHSDIHAGANVGNRTQDDSLEESHDTTSPRTLGTSQFTVITQDVLRMSGIEPETTLWKRAMIPLHHTRWIPMRGIEPRSSP